MSPFHDPVEHFTRCGVFCQESTDGKQDCWQKYGSMSSKHLQRVPFVCALLLVSTTLAVTFSTFHTTTYNCSITSPVLMYKAVCPVLLRCAHWCSIDTACKSIVFESGKRLCSLNSGIKDVHELIGDCGKEMVYGELEQVCTIIVNAFVFVVISHEHYWALRLHIFETRTVRCFTFVLVPLLLSSLQLFSSSIFYIMVIFCLWLYVRITIVK